MSEEDGIESTGGYFVYLVHPLRGTIEFNLEYNTEISVWLPADPMINSLVENTIIQKIVDELPKR